MDNYALFFDIDGTLVSFETHEIPPSAVLALTQAKANGAKVYISTGRPVNFITNLGAIEHLIDGYITANGACCFVGAEEVCCRPIPGHEVDMLLGDARKHDYPCIVVGEKDVAVFNPKEIVERVFCGELAVGSQSFQASVEAVLQQRILQMTPFFLEEHEAELMKQLKGCTSGRWHPAFTDITAKEADKGKGLLAMAAYLGIDIGRTIAFGDGGNDLSIIRQAGIGVAMGNALDVLKNAADHVTTSVDDNGVFNALKHFSII
jgi:Cof subfamily protein (haloacid dehalogenase superfamily)